MAIAYIVEYASVPTQGGDKINIPMEPALVSTNVDFSSGTPSHTFNSATKYVIIIPDAAVHMLFGTSPTAAVTNMRYPADQPVDRGVSTTATAVSFIAAV